MPGVRVARGTPRAGRGAAVCTGAQKGELSWQSGTTLYQAGPGRVGATIICNHYVRAHYVRAGVGSSACSAPCMYTVCFAYLATPVINHREASTAGTAPTPSELWLATPPSLSRAALVVSADFPKDYHNVSRQPLSMQLPSPSLSPPLPLHFVPSTGFDIPENKILVVYPL